MAGVFESMRLLYVLRAFVVNVLSQSTRKLLLAGKHRRAFFQERFHAFVIVAAAAGDFL